MITAYPGADELAITLQLLDCKTTKQLLTRRFVISKIIRNGSQSFRKFHEAVRRHAAAVEQKAVRRALTHC